MHLTLEISDWRRESSEEALISYETSGVEPICISSILLNGRGRVQCPGADFLSQFETEASGPYTAKGCVPPTSPLLAGASVDADTIDASMVLNDTYYSCDPTDTPYSVVQVDRTQGWAAVGIINGGSTVR